jgi:hypothetical protein
MMQRCTQDRPLWWDALQHCLLPRYLQDAWLASRCAKAWLRRLQASLIQQNPRLLQTAHGLELLESKLKGPLQRTDKADSRKAQGNHKAVCSTLAASHAEGIQDTRHSAVPALASAWQGPDDRGRRRQGRKQY